MQGKTKRCPRCGETKSRSKFRLQTTGHVHAWCRPCENRYNSRRVTVYRRRQREEARRVPPHRCTSAACCDGPATRPVNGFDLGPLWGLGATNAELSRGGLPLVGVLRQMGAAWRVYVSGQDFRVFTHRVNATTWAKRQGIRLRSWEEQGQHE